MLTEYFFLFFSETECFFEANLQTEIFSPKKTIAPPPHLKLNGRSLITNETQKRFFFIIIYSYKVKVKEGSGKNICGDRKKLFHGAAEISFGNTIFCSNCLGIEVLAGYLSVYVRNKILFHKS